MEERTGFLFSPIVLSDEMDPELREEMEQLAAERESRQEEIKAVLGPLCQDEAEAEENGPGK